eukprot:766850-Hanusia_phi.AAC.7
MYTDKLLHLAEAIKIDTKKLSSLAFYLEEAITTRILDHLISHLGTDSRDELQVTEHVSGSHSHVGRT